MEFVHDCKCCKYLRTTEVAGRILDWYQCSCENRGHLLARHGDAPYEYTAYPLDVLNGEADKSSILLVEAQRVYKKEVKS